MIQNCWKTQQQIKNIFLVIGCLLLVLVIGGIVAIFVVTALTGQPDSNKSGSGSKSATVLPPKDCADIVAFGNSSFPGKSRIFLNGNAVEVYCEPDGWTVFQSRGQFGNPSDYFYRNWSQYENGFGLPGKEHWLGLKHVYEITKNNPSKMKIFLEEFNGNTATLFYTDFYIKDNTGYSFTYDRGSGGSAAYTLDTTRDIPFSTYDNEQDTHNDDNCAERHRGAWWFKSCGWINLNGLNFAEGEEVQFERGIFWSTLTAFSESLKSTTMAIRPMNYSSNN